MSSEEHLARAAELRKANPKSRAAFLHELVAKAMPSEPDAKLVEEYRERLADEAP